MNESESSFYEESSFVKIFEGVGSIGAIFICPTYDARDLALLKCTYLNNYLEKQIQAVLTSEK